ncbi:tyrosine-type recombinase/integrase [Neolewinella lacunae]|uniref:Tyrosine-type recombinase/integrase n=1 Tax=Neolewinella lacunae TaxID=1517758 RepID=A0A923PHC1_9BACT|nr:tyrosine-type recombinase/integrase [Neolewinella lacunae]MBC6994082.1 tyrosine-type recombinase/integrase [Neolewinella lacunae]MDN3636047.1 tyrosine-type recombinase/integrase [Neolewinella lacunae]
MPEFYYDKAIFRPDFSLEQVQRPRKSLTLPSVLSIQEIDRLLRASENLKHLTILYTLYGSGLRLAELLALRLTDVHWERHQLLVREGKGRKDRVVMLSQQLKAMLQQYFEAYQPKGWLFNGQDGENPYSPRSVQAVVRACARRAGIHRKVTPHTLRHCFATHLLERGTDVRYILELLGYKDIKTTLLYTHVSDQHLRSIVSPLDDLLGGEKRK